VVMPLTKAALYPLADELGCPVIVSRRADAASESRITSGRGA
jgi:hypothetical protein